MFKILMNKERTEHTLKQIELIVLVVSIPVAIYLFFRYENLQKDLAIQTLKQQQEIAEMQIAIKKSPMSQVSSSISASVVKEYSDGSALFEIHFIYSIRNVTETPNFIPYRIIKVYKGVLVDDVSNSDFWRLNAPGETDAKSNSLGAVDWKLIHTELGAGSSKTSQDIQIDQEASELLFSKEKNISVVPNAGATGQLPPYVTFESRLKILYKGSKNDLVGFRLIAPNKAQVIKESETTSSQLVSTWEITDWERVSNIISK